LLDWFAYKIQNPGKRLTVAIMIIGDHGLGKSLLAEIYGAIFGSNYSEIKNSNLHEGFKEWLLDKLFIPANEILSSGSRADANRLKNMVTDQMNIINNKYGAKFSQRNHASYYLTSNDVLSLLLDPGDRRFFICDMRAAPVPDGKFFARVLKWRDSNGAARLYDYLLNRHKISADFNPTERAPKTEGKDMMIALNRVNFMTQFAEEVMTDPKRVMGYAGEEVGVYDLRLLYDKFDPMKRYPAGSEKKLSQELTDAGAVNKTSIRTSQGTKNLWIVGPKDKLERWKREPPTLLAQEYEGYFNQLKMSAGEDPFVKGYIEQGRMEGRAEILREQMMDKGKVTDITAGRKGKQKSANSTGTERK